MNIADFINLGSVVATIVAVAVGIQLWRKQGLLEEQSRKIYELKGIVKRNKDRLSKLEDFCKTVCTTEKEQYNVIVIGPRASGKSSIVSLWCEIDRLIESISPTVSFSTYDYNYGDKYSRKENYYDPKIDINRLKKIKKSIKFFDYAGEDKEIPNAIEKITDLPNCTIIMVFNSDPGYANDNRRYFSRSLIEKINTTFNRTGFETSNVRGIYVVFNKIDLFNDSGSNFDDQLATIRDLFSDNTANIESIFGVDVKYKVTSALTNHNIVNLLQDVVRSYGVHSGPRISDH
ncbi:MAG: GTPase domain-containing protein [Candidatus Thiosymbion ectosymbiont of Robbea hypermnestra]|nr:GTPase domain-containing protein [Candidatus Thiosymbion ectosymbiont of Robbea hypermnestra]